MADRGRHNARAIELSGNGHGPNGPKSGPNGPPRRSNGHANGKALPPLLFNGSLDMARFEREAKVIRALVARGVPPRLAIQKVALKVQAMRFARKGVRIDVKGDVK